MFLFQQWKICICLWFFSNVLFLNEALLYFFMVFYGYWPQPEVRNTLSKMVILKMNECHNAVLENIPSQYTTAS